MMHEGSDLGELVQHCVLPKESGMDAMEAYLVVVQEVPTKAELRFYAVRGSERERLTNMAVRELLRAHVPPKPVAALSEVERLVEISVLRAEVDRLRPVYAAGRVWRAAVVHGIDDIGGKALVAAIDAAVAAETEADR